MASKILVDEIAPQSHATDVTITTGKKIAGANTQFKITGGATGQVLSTDGSGALSWTANGVGKIGQVLQAQKTDTFTSASSSWIDITDLTVTITPSAATSKVLVVFNIGSIGTYGSAHVALRLMRDSSAIAIGDAAGSRIQATHAEYLPDAGSYGMHSMSWLDEPATTSAVVYKVQGLAESSNTFYVNRSQTDTDSDSYSRCVSTITVMEVLA